LQWSLIHVIAPPQGELTTNGPATATVLSACLAMTTIGNALTALTYGSLSWSELLFSCSYWE